MPITLETTPYGPPAHETLSATIDRLKAGDPLRPVTVAVPSNHVGIAARRALGRRRGIAAVTFLTPYRLAELLGASALAASGRRPVSTPVLAGAVRAVLQDDPGHFAGVHTHPTTERSLVRAHRALSEVTPAGLRAIAATSTRAADVVRVHRAVGTLLQPHFSDEQDLITAAIAAIGAPEDAVTAQLGAAVLFLPQRLTTGQTRLLRALGDHQPLHIVAGVTGQVEADAAVRDGVSQLGVGWPDPAPSVPGVADRALSVSDADDEVRHAVRLVVDAARSGSPLGRCAIVYGSHDPYARLVGDALDAAGIPWFGSSVQTAESSLLGRSLLALLALPDHDFSRREVTAWLAGAPIRGVDNRPAPVAAWERTSRAAGVVGGIDQWRIRLARHADELLDDAAVFERNPEETWRADRLRREADTTRELLGFIDALHAALQPGGRATTWAGLAGWCRTLVRTYLGGETLRQGWPPDERSAAARIDASIDRLGDLDGVDPAPSVAAFRRALELQLGDDLGRHGTFGNGVLVGGAALAIGLELDLAVVLGMAEGSFPTRRRDDPLLPDRVRAAVGRDLPPRADAVHDDHRALLAVMAAAGQTVFTYPRGDLRRSAERAPSRWLLDSAEQRDGVRPATDELDRRTGEWMHEVPSFVAGLRATDFPAHGQEYDVRALLDAADGGATELSRLPIVASRTELGRAVALVTGRRSPRFTRFDGNLATDGDLRGARLPSPADADQITSATRLESWAACPHAYFVRHVLGVHPVADPEEQYRISPLTLGNLVHGVLERWLREALDAGTVPVSGAAWGETAVARLAEIAAEEADRLEGRGLVGRAVYWQRDRRVVLSDLAHFPEFDRDCRAAAAATPLAAELAFGMPHTPTPPVTIALPGGRRIRVRGSIDRVDEGHGDELIVIDYKTGRSRRYAGLSADDPTPGGTHLQLALYGAAAREVLGRPGSVTRGAYWFVSRNGPFGTAGYPIAPEVEARVLATVEAIVEGIASGLFPQRPAVPGWRMFVDCEFCEPDGLGLAHQYADWMRIQTEPDLDRYLRVIGESDEKPDAAARSGASS